MTRGEALKKMQAIKSYMTSGNPIWSVTEIGEAFDMAIDALEQPEIIRCKDCKYKKVYCFPPKYYERDYCVKHEKTVDVADFCSLAERRGEQDG